VLYVKTDLIRDLSIALVSPEYLIGYFRRQKDGFKMLDRVPLIIDIKNIHRELEISVIQNRTKVIGRELMSSGKLEKIIKLAKMRMDMCNTHWNQANSAVP